MTDLKTGNFPRRNRIIALAFVSVLLVLVYGPLAQWFVAADRLLYDQLAGILPNKPQNDTYIVSINRERASPAAELNEYGRVIVTLQKANARRIILANPPTLPASDKLPGWLAALRSGVPVFVPSQHRLAAISPNDGFVAIQPDEDGVLRNTKLWYLNGGVMSPSLPLAVALADPTTATAPGMSNFEYAIFFSN